MHTYWNPTGCLMSNTFVFFGNTNIRRLKYKIFKKIIITKCTNGIFVYTFINSDNQIIYNTYVKNIILKQYNSGFHT